MMPSAISDYDAKLSDKHVAMNGHTLNVAFKLK